MGTALKMRNNQMDGTHSPIDAAISSMWGIGRFDNINCFFDEGSKMGFMMFELNHKVTSHMLSGIKLNGYAIPVIHEPCPADIDAQILKDRDWLISSLDEANRFEGVRVIKRSIDLAHDLGSQVVVVHCGHIPGLREMEDQLWALYRAGKAGTPEYAEMKDEVVRKKTGRAEATLEVVHHSLEELAGYAGQLGIRLGLENRYHLSDFPGLDEMKTLLEGLDQDIVGFWYDVGHAQTLSRLGFYPHEDWLHNFESRMFGVHLHDVIGLDDHHTPGSGEVDWDMVASHLPKDIFHTLEVQTFNSPQQIKTGLNFLLEKGCIAYS
jgi:sugar phosphate isomerase/epimerase